MLRVRRHLAELGGVGMLTLALACQAPAPATTSGGASQPSANPIKIGALFSTTGTLAPFGNDALPGAQIFVEEINAKGGINGRPIELVFVDDESKPEQTVTAAKRLIQQDRVVAIAGPVSQVVTAAALPVIAESRIPSLNCGCIVGPMESFQFTTFPSLNMMKNQAEFAKAHGVTEIAVIAQAGALADTIKAQNVPDLEAEGIKIIAFEQFQTTDTDLTPVLAKVRELGAKQVYVAASGVQAATAAKNFKQMNYPGSYWTFAGNANDTFINLVGDAADIVNVAGTKILVYKELPDSDPSKARLAAFAQKYVAKTGREPGTYGAFFYDVMASLADAIQKAGDSPDKIRDALETQSNLQVLNGVVNRNPKEHNGLSPEWLSVGIDPVSKKFTIKKS
jgi:branched-chain amino acid transport system substrate-binding protein